MSLNVLANFFFAFFFSFLSDRPTDPTLANPDIDEKHKNKWGWPYKNLKPLQDFLQPELVGNSQEALSMFPQLTKRLLRPELGKF